MSYFRKSILLFVFMFGVFSPPYASAKGKCTSPENHRVAFGADCKGRLGSGSYANQGQCYWSRDSYSQNNACKTFNPTVSPSFGAVGFCPDGANGSPCACNKGTNWREVPQQCQISR
jgi:hypothetical protein